MLPALACPLARRASLCAFRAPVTVCVFEAFAPGLKDAKQLSRRDPGLVIGQEGTCNVGKVEFSNEIKLLSSFTKLD